jgi:hypothetical protein
MSFTETRLINPTQLTTSASSALYTVPAGKSAIIKQLVITNTTSTSATFAFYINGNTADKALFSSTSVSGNDSLVINLSQVLNAGNTINALASANTTLNLTVSGVVNDGPLNPLSIYIADNAITTPKIADASVTTAKIAAGAVVTEDIANNAVTQGKLSTDVPLSGFRNSVINGGFDVWQRGTSPTAIASTSSSAFLADRWQATRYASGSKQSQIFPSLDGFRYGIRIQRDSGNTSTNVIYLSQSFEGDVAIKLANKPVALSFYARAGSNYSPTSSFLYVGLNTGTGSEANVAYGIFAGLIPPSINSNVTLTTSWQRFTFIANIPSGTTQAGLLFSMSPTGTASTNDYFEITGVQLEQSLQPTPFEQRPIGVELALCQRYFWKLISNGISYLSFQYAGTQYRLTIPHPVQMRVNPHTVSTSTWQGGTTPSLGAASVLSTNWSTTGGWFYVDGSTSIEISAEL